MKEIPFDIKHKYLIESGEYMVVTDRNRTPIHILTWDGPNKDYPIIGVDDKGLASNYSETGMDIDEECESLIIVDMLRDLTEVEKVLKDFVTVLAGRLIHIKDPEPYFGVFAKKITQAVLKDVPMWHRGFEVCAEYPGAKSNHDDIWNIEKGCLYYLPAGSTTARILVLKDLLDKLPKEDCL